jgi:ABC-type sulfate transport system substrate-binding protein
MQRLGVNLSAEDVVAVIDKQVRQHKTKHTGLSVCFMVYFIP